MVRLESPSVDVQKPKLEMQFAHAVAGEGPMGQQLRQGPGRNNQYTESYNVLRIRTFLFTHRFCSLS